ncbi:prepilin-type N-terminal cleavage/methylation domain-containing protein [Patescibacteria group bacterium]|nr:prepilin-type N-terminal cleavage/methylation domain-containing protein [Patescibacteria group bacterium]MBU1075086.1 prepilin-type N-terminal cleavage/methylation domain-containing protein [Patescibacteria group bacterium]MBU1952113.1 prepilin-type N-terminal cleavage/methylation domain-containing protein [Patescibacteria group bacterium]
MKHQKSKPGFTLIEIIVVVGIMGVLTTIIYQFVLQGHDLFNQSRDQALAQDTLRKVMTSVAKELRAAQNADTGAYLLANAEEQSITFYSDVDGDDSRERLRYFLSGTNFQRGIIDPPSADEVIETVVENIRNIDSIFTYFDENYTGIEDPLTHPINLAEVRLVHMKFDVDIDPNLPPDQISIETSIMIRNLKTNF